MPAPYINRQLIFLASILPTEIRRKQAMLSLVCRAQEPELVLYERLLSFLLIKDPTAEIERAICTRCTGNFKRLFKSDTSVACWAETKWNTEWQSNTSCLRTFILDVNPKPLEMYLSIPSSIRLNRFRTGVGMFRSTMYKWGTIPIAAC